MKRTIKIVIISLFVFLLYIVNFNLKKAPYIGKSNFVLMNHKYNSVYNGSKTLYLIKFEPPLTKFQQYQFNKSEQIDLIVAEGSEFIISQEANAIRPYRWKIIEITENKVIEYMKENFIEPCDFKFTSLKGDSNRRQNFLFKAISTGNAKLVMQYNNADNSEMDTEVTVNFKVK